MGKIIRNGVEYSGACEDATAVNYNNSLSGLNAQTVQEGIDELSSSLEEIQTTTSIEVDSLVSLSHGGFMLKKFGNVVMLSNNGTYIKPSSDITADTIMCNIPEEYRPSNILVLISYHGHSSKNYPMLISISPNGNVSFSPIDYSGNSMSSSLYWQGYITWIID